MNNWYFAFGFQRFLVNQSKKTWKPGEGSLHPGPEGRGIRDPLHSQCYKRLLCSNILTTKAFIIKYLREII